MTGSYFENSVLNIKMCFGVMVVRSFILPSKNDNPDIGRWQWQNNSNSYPRQTLKNKIIDHSNKIINFNFVCFPIVSEISKRRATRDQPTGKSFRNRRKRSVVKGLGSRDGWGRGRTGWSEEGERNTCKTWKGEININRITSKYT